jgi:tetratricopeptide (TPR) repeat protein
MKRVTLFLAIAIMFLVILPQQQWANAKDTWTSIQSKNFFLVGNANEKEIKQVAVRLEQFREVFTHLFPKVKFTTPVPTTVVVFKSDSSFKPFKPGPNIAGYFQPGQDVNYISLTTELQGTQNPFTVIFHEYIHLLVNNTMSNAPVWFNEGLAEYYSTFTISDDQKIVLGNPIGNHVFLLRQNKMLPLRTLFQVDHKSPHYNERNKQSIFYAQSWALTHYLIVGKAGRAEQLGVFIDKISSNVPMEQAFQDAFQMSIETMEKELREYVRQDRYNILRGHFERKLETDNSLQTGALSEADAQAYLGDLLLHSNRKDCETYLQKALALDPNSSMANAAMGMAKVRDGKPDEALAHLERAVTANSQNYLVHYYYALALSKLNDSGSQPVNGFAPETSARIRQELLKAIELRPDFPPSYNLLGFVSLVTGNNIQEAQKLVLRALNISPGRNELILMLGQLYLRNGDYKQARELLEHVAKTSAEDEMRQHAETILAQLTAMEAYQLRSKPNEMVRSSNQPGTQEIRQTESSLPTVTAGTEDSTPRDPSSYLREVLRKPGPGETQVQAILQKIECDAKGIIFVVKSGDQILRLRTNTFDDMEITTYNPEVKGEITCGVRRPEDSVLVCFIAQVDKRSKTDGVIKSIEFVPGSFKLKPN